MNNPVDFSIWKRAADRIAGLPMVSRLCTKINRFVDHRLPERQVHIRSDYRVRYVTVSTRHQVFGIVGATFLVVVLTSMGAGLWTTTSGLSDRDAAIADLEAKRDRLQAEIDLLDQDLQSRTQALESRQDFVDDMLQTLVPGATPDMDGVTAPTAATNADGETAPMGGPVETPSQRKATDKPSESHDDQLSVIEDAQTQSMLRMAEIINHSAGQWRTAMSSLGLDSDEMIALSAQRGPAFGQPWHLLTNDGLSPLADLYARDPLTQSLAQEALTLSHLRYAAGNVPLAIPLAVEYYISSYYGRRKDPFTKKRVMHSGVDLAGRWKAPVMATARGTVTFVGWKGAYGRMVEVDHGNGFRTRYGHLAKILVEKGQSVGLADHVGLMGNSGRSTGTHLHYEIRYNGKALNPTKFFKAAQHVQAI